MLFAPCSNFRNFHDLPAYLEIKDKKRGKFRQNLLRLFYKKRSPYIFRQRRKYCCGREQQGPRQVSGSCGGPGRDQQPMIMQEQKQQTFLLLGGFLGSHTRKKKSENKNEKAPLHVVSGQWRTTSCWRTKGLKWTKMVDLVNSVRFANSSDPRGSFSRTSVKATL